MTDIEISGEGAHLIWRNGENYLYLQLGPGTTVHVYHQINGGAKWEGVSREDDERIAEQLNAALSAIYSPRLGQRLTALNASGEAVEAIIIAYNKRSYPTSVEVYDSPPEITRPYRVGDFVSNKTLDGGWRMTAEGKWEPFGTERTKLIATAKDAAP